MVNVCSPCLSIAVLLPSRCFENGAFVDESLCGLAAWAWRPLGMPSIENSDMPLADIAVQVHGDNWPYEPYAKCVMHVCMCVCMSVCIMYVCMYVCVCVCVCLCLVQCYGRAADGCTRSSKTNNSVWIAIVVFVLLALVFVGSLPFVSKFVYVCVCLSVCVCVCLHTLT